MCLGGRTELVFLPDRFPGRLTARYAAPPDDLVVRLLRCRDKLDNHEWLVQYIEQ
jgi:hypothetical protein